MQIRNVACGLHLLVLPTTLKVKHGSIHFAFIVLEYSQIDCLVSQVAARSFGVTASGAEQDQEPGASRRIRLTVDPDFHP